MPRLSDPKPTDSIISAETRAATIRAESERIEREQAAAADRQKDHRARQDAEARKTEDEDVRKVAASLSDLGTRDQLLDRIREMRNDVPVGTPEPPPLTERMLQALKEEQEAGRAAIKKAEAEIEFNRKIQAKFEADERERLGSMVPVHHPNPGMNEQFAASGGTLGKKR